MLNTIYRLRSPRNFEIAVKDEQPENHVVVRPISLSICHADQRYYQGKRAKAVLDKKLPMALIHEGIGEIVADYTGTFSVGERVVMVPNMPAEKDDVIAENYAFTSHFRGSTADGFMQEYIVTDPDRLVTLPENIDLEVATFLEMVTVSYHAISRFKKIAHSRRNIIGVWGDGNLGFMTSLLIKHMLPESRLYVFGIDQNKLADFTFSDECFIVNDLPKGLRIDHAFECVGSAASASAIDQIIDCINPEGTISLLGVSEESVPINTRMVLEKGLRLFGSSRSGREDYLGTVKLLNDNPDIVQYLRTLVGCVKTVRCLADAVEAFETDISKSMGKTIMKWEI